MFQWFTRVLNIGYEGPSDNPAVAIRQCMSTMLISDKLRRHTLMA